MNPDKELDLVDLVEQSELNSMMDDMGFSEAYGMSEEEYEEEWN